MQSVSSSPPPPPPPPPPSLLVFTESPSVLPLKPTTPTIKPISEHSALLDSIKDFKPSILKPIDHSQKLFVMFYKLIK